MAEGAEVVLLCVVTSIYAENRSNKKHRTFTGETFFVETEEQRCMQCIMSDFRV
jgi:hypothetical protein